MTSLHFGRLDVYRAALDLFTTCERIAAALPPERAYMADQLRRAAFSIPLNIAEGAGEYAPKEKARFYRIAKRSGTETAAIVDALRTLNAARNMDLDAVESLASEVVAKLTRMTINLEAGESTASRKNTPGPRP